MKRSLTQHSKRTNCQMLKTERDEIFEKTGQRREDFSVCMGCKICASVCTLNDIGKNVNPQDLLLSIFLGHIPNDHSIVTYCTSCYRCVESCPWRIKIPEIVRAIRERSKGDLFTRTFKSSIAIFGRAYEPYIFFRILPFLLKKGYLRYLPRWIRYMNFSFPPFLLRR